MQATENKSLPVRGKNRGLSGKKNEIDKRSEGEDMVSGEKGSKCER